MEGVASTTEGDAPPGLLDLGEDIWALLVQHISESNRPARTILRTLDALCRSCAAAHVVVGPRLAELRGLPVDVWAATARPGAAQLTWTIENFAGLEDERVLSPPFHNRPHTWRLVLFPGGDDVERYRPEAPPHLSLFVEVADAAVLPHGWVREAHFLMTVRNVDPSRSIVRYARHDFESSARDWGFRELVPLSELVAPRVDTSPSPTPRGGDGKRRDAATAEAVGGFILPGGRIELQCKVWGITDAMRQAELRKQASQLNRPNRVAAGAASTGIGASTASSTSWGSEDSSYTGRRISFRSRPLSALRQRLAGLFSFRHGSARRRREVYVSSARSE